MEFDPEILDDEYTWFDQRKKAQQKHDVQLEMPNEPFLPEGFKWDDEITEGPVQHERCVICGEEIRNSEETAEMYDAALIDDADMWSETEAGVVHVQCGLDKGWVIS